MVCEWCGNVKAEMFCDSNCAYNLLVILRQLAKYRNMVPLSDKDSKMLELLEQVNPHPTFKRGDGTKETVVVG